MIRATPSPELLSTLSRQRRKLGLSQAKLGAVVRMPQSQLARIETGASDVRLSTLTEVARALDLEPMLIPKHLVPAVQYLMSGPEQASKGSQRLVGNAPDDPSQDISEHWEP